MQDQQLINALDAVIVLLPSTEQQSENAALVQWFETAEKSETGDKLILLDYTQSTEALVDAACSLMDLLLHGRREFDKEDADEEDADEEDADEGVEEEDADEGVEEEDADEEDADEEVDEEDNGHAAGLEREAREKVEGVAKGNEQRHKERISAPVIEPAEQWSLAAASTDQQPMEFAGVTLQHPMSTSLRMQGLGMHLLACDRCMFAHRHFHTFTHSRSIH
jgi:hypothetical protein